MILQNVVLPDLSICSDEKIFYHTNGNRIITEFPVSLTKGDEMSFDSYFNAFSMKKWNKYTDIENLSLTLEAQGNMLINIYSKSFGQKQELLCSGEIDSEIKTRVSVHIPIIEADMIYFSVIAKKASLLYCAYFEDSMPEENYRDINIALNICTFHREKELNCNLNSLVNNIFDNEDSPLHDKLIVFISDNGRTLDTTMYAYDKIHIFYNKNVGGAGGFTRGLIEVLNANNDDNPISHVIFMDDDIVFHPATLELTYFFLKRLKNEYYSACIGGSMLRKDMPNILYESGAQWNSGSINALKQDLDLEKFEDVLSAEQEEKIEYQGWWYCCFSLEGLSVNNLPLPFFIHRDDIEYSLRNVKNFITLNGIGVWHEPFKQKHVAFLEYYDVRNIAITNAIHCIDYTKSQYKKMLLGRVMKNVFRFHYTETELNFRAAEDFCRGVDWLKNQDGEILHKEISQMGYKKVPIEDLRTEFNGMRLREKKIDLATESGSKSKIKYLITLNGWIFPACYKAEMPVTLEEWRNYFRMKKVLIRSGNNGYFVEKSWKDLFRVIKKYFKVCKMIDSRYDYAKQEYHERYTELTNMDFWKLYLEI